MSGRRWPHAVYGVGSEPDARFSLANERTFLAWIRTALAFLAAAVAVVAIARLSDRFGPEIRLAAVLLVAASLACSAGGFLRWAQTERAIRLGRPLPSAPIMVTVTVLLGLVAVVAGALALLA